MNIRQQPTSKGSSTVVGRQVAGKAAQLFLFTLAAVDIARSQEAGAHFDTQDQTVAIDNGGQYYSNRLLGIERNKTFHHNEDGSKLRETNSRYQSKEKLMKEMDLEVMILIGAIAFLGLVLLFIIFCLCVFFYKERKESKQEMLELESASVSYASRTHYSQMPMYQFNEGYNTAQTSQRTIYNTESTYQQSDYYENPDQQQKRRRKRSKHSSQGGGGSSHRSRNRSGSQGQYQNGGADNGGNRRQDYNRNNSPGQMDDSYRQNSYDAQGNQVRRFGSSDDLSNQNRSLNNSGTHSSGQNSLGHNQMFNDSQQSMQYNSRNAFGVIKEELGETSRASDSAPGDKSFQNKMSNTDQMKDMLFDSQIGEEEYADRRAVEAQRLIDKNAPQSDNYNDRPKGKKLPRQRKQ